MPRDKRPRRDSKKNQPRQRRAMSAHGGRIDLAGDATLAAALGKAWRAVAGEGRRLTHGLHTYPARLHPDVVRHLIEEYSAPGDLVVDPFAGSGTILVEALALGRLSFGSDVNPVACAIERVKTTRRPGPARRALEQLASEISNYALRATRSGIQEGEPPSDIVPFLQYFEPDVLREIAIMRDGIRQVEDPEFRFALTVVLSSILIRVSNKSAETSDGFREGRMPPGAAARMFKDRAVELGAALADLGREAPKDAKDPIVVRGDALALPLKSGVAQLVLTSPPYLGTYDYFGVQELRGGLLGLDLRPTRKHEIGSREAAALHPAGALPRFRDDMIAAFSEIHRVLKPDGTFLLVLGDSSIYDRHIDGLRIASDAADGSRFQILAAASECRPRTYGPTRNRERREHLVLLKKR